MKMLDRLLQRKETTPYSSSALAQLLSRVFGGATKSGATVNEVTALEVSTVLACVRVLAEGVAQVPFKLLRSSADGRTIEPARNKRLYDVLHRRANRWQSSFAFRETMMLHTVLCGTGYAFISRVGAGQEVESLIPLLPERTTMNVAESGEISYDVRGKDGSVRRLGEADVWRWTGPSWDVYKGLPVLRLARESVGLAMATEEMHARLHANGVRMSGTYSVDGTLNKDAYKQLKQWIDQEFAGVAKSGGVMLLDRNASFSPNSMTGVDAQHLETRRNQVEEICRFFRVMPIMVGYSDKAATYASSEQMFLAHLVHTMSPWYERIEQSADVFLLSDSERAEGYYTKFVTAGMLRGALKDTAEFITKLVGLGVMTRNEGRAKLDLNWLEGLDEPLTPINMAVGAEPAAEPEKDPA